MYAGYPCAQSLRCGPSTTRWRAQPRAGRASPSAGDKLRHAYLGPPPPLLRARDHIRRGTRKAASTGPASPSRVPAPGASTSTQPAKLATAAANAKQTGMIIAAGTRRAPPSPAGRASPSRLVRRAPYTQLSVARTRAGDTLVCAHVRPRWRWVRKRPSFEPSSACAPAYRNSRSGSFDPPFVFARKQTWSARNPQVQDMDGYPYGMRDAHPIRALRLWWRATRSKRRRDAPSLCVRSGEGEKREKWPMLSIILTMHTSFAGAVTPRSRRSPLGHGRVQEGLGLGLGFALPTDGRKLQGDEENGERAGRARASEREQCISSDFRDSGFSFVRWRGAVRAREDLRHC
ncbi:hypothetical protein C8R47DRAFT_724918 [Mycena vitilis]|nr:hypothetical protein C8R47DRAFT_724918 [Mycena vitilis]